MANFDSNTVKQKASDLGAHLVGIAAASSFNLSLPGTNTGSHAGNIASNTTSGLPILADNPMSRTRMGQSNRIGLDNIVEGAKSAIVIGVRLLWAMSRLKRADSREAHYTGELILTRVEEIAMELVWHLEEMGYPSMPVPASYSRSQQLDQLEHGPVSLPHLAVAAGLGTLGFNQMLLTPQYGPRVVLGAVVTTAELTPDPRIETALCPGESCGRCMLACPGDAIGRWEMNVEKCRPFSSPYGYQFVRGHAQRIAEEQDSEQQLEMIRSKDTFMIWQSMLRGVGVLTGCTRCYDVCPVGSDYEEHLSESEKAIPESTDEKVNRLDRYRELVHNGLNAPDYEANRAWIGKSGNEEINSQ